MKSAAAGTEEWSSASLINHADVCVGRSKLPRTNARDVAMGREHLSAVNVKDGVENPGCNGWSLVTTGQELWRERVLHEKDAAFRARARLASTAVRMERSRTPFTQPWMPSTARYETAAQQQLALRQEIFSRNWRIRQESTVPNLAALTGTCHNGAITGRVRSKPALTQSWSTTVTT